MEADPVISHFRKRKVISHFRKRKLTKLTTDARPVVLIADPSLALNRQPNLAGTVGLMG